MLITESHTKQDFGLLSYHSIARNQFNYTARNTLLSHFTLLFHVLRTFYALPCYRCECIPLNFVPCRESQLLKPFAMIVLSVRYLQSTTLHVHFLTLLQNCVKTASKIFGKPESMFCIHTACEAYVFLRIARWCTLQYTPTNFAHISDGSYFRPVETRFQKTNKQTKNSLITALNKSDIILKCWFAEGVLFASSNHIIARFEFLSDFGFVLRKEGGRGQFTITRIVTKPGRLRLYVVLCTYKSQQHDCRFQTAEATMYDLPLYLSWNV